MDDTLLKKSFIEKFIFCAGDASASKGVLKSIFSQNLGKLLKERNCKNTVLVNDFLENVRWDYIVLGISWFSK